MIDQSCPTLPAALNKLGDKRRFYLVLQNSFPTSIHFNVPTPDPSTTYQNRAARLHNITQNKIYKSTKRLEPIKIHIGTLINQMVIYHQFILLYSPKDKPRVQKSFVRFSKYTTVTCLCCSTNIFFSFLLK